MTEAGTSSASRLCAACGMCCNGVMFYAVNLQPEDSEKQLKSHGLRLKVKKKKVFIPQPCPAHHNFSCSIYADRPQRCRLFNCRQLQLVQSGQSSEEEAADLIREARVLTLSIQELLLKAGSTNLNRSLRTRFELATAQPLDPRAQPEAWTVREDLVAKMTELESLLADSFRV